MNFQITKNYLTLIIVFFSFVHTTYASFEITEIMYDLDGTDTNREWVEVKNTGTDNADLSKWFLFTDNTKHALVPQSESQVPPGGYAVIAQNVPKFKTDWPNFTGLLFDSSWTGFSNDGETIALKDPDQNIVSQVTFTSSQGGAGDGNSLQKVNVTWIGGVPTPGIENQGGSGGGGGDTGAGNGTPGSSVSTTPLFTKKKEVEVPKIITNIIANGTVFAGVPFTVDARTTGLNKENLNFGRFVWSFGDGVAKYENTHVPFQYEYKYPGQYVMALSYYGIATGNVVDATDRLIVTVLPSSISISSIGKEPDLFVELENKSNIEVDLSGWSIKSIGTAFYIPQGTIILPHQKLKLSQKATNFSAIDTRSLSLQNSIGEVSDTYPSNGYISKSNYQNNLLSNKSSKYSSSSNIINLNDLGASAGNNKTVNFSTSLFAWIGFFSVIIIGFIAVILLRNKNSEDRIDKGLSASDMTIIE